MIAVKTIAKKALDTAFNLAADITQDVTYNHQSGPSIYVESTGISTPTVLQMEGTGMFFTLTEKEAPGQVRIGDQRIIIRASELPNLTARGPTTDDFIVDPKGTKYQVFDFSLDPTTQMYTFFAHLIAP